MTKKITSFLMALIMLVTCLAGTTISYAANKNDIAEKSEVITIDGVSYQYVNEYADGKEITRILNLTDNTEDVLYYNEESGIAFLNDAPVAYVEDVVSNFEGATKNGITPYADTYWKWHDSSTKRITWLQGVAGAILAGIIAGVIPNVGTFTVIARIGVNVLAAVAGACNGAYVDCVGYTHVLDTGRVQVRCDWTFRPNTFDTYGPFSQYIY